VAELDVAGEVEVAKEVEAKEVEEEVAVKLTLPSQ